jgi:hypothetical protein
MSSADDTKKLVGMFGFAWAGLYAGSGIRGFVNAHECSDLDR